MSSPARADAFEEAYQRVRRALRGGGGLPDDLGDQIRALLEQGLEVPGDPEALHRAVDLAADALRDSRAREPVGAALDPARLEAIAGELMNRLAASDPPDAEPTPQQRAAWAWLDMVRHPSIARRFETLEQRNAWLEVILSLIDASRYTVGALLVSRVQAYGPHTFMRVPSRGAGERISWLEAGTEVDRIAKGLLALREEVGEGRIGIFSNNRFEMALTDLACLSTGLVNVMIPAHATESDLVHLVENLDVSVLIVSGEAQLKRIRSVRQQIPGVRAIVSFDGAREGERKVMSLSALIHKGRAVPEAELGRARWSARPGDIATVMTTSGTTGQPKGIQFTQRNIVSKRFARNLAIPEIGDHDVFLCYLPLFHTFGRYLELVGCLYWGATYVFLEDHSREGLIESFRRHRPSVFISIPKKWMQLYEEISEQVDLQAGSDDELRAAARRVVQDRLRWGLSAAGYLPAEVFRFFQRQGVELMSGFGMTEATGGITMTPPGAYRDDTLGVALPGIEARLDADGEMMIRGPYVMVGYIAGDGSSGLDEEGWLRTGDLMELDEAGYFRIVDRKKDLYKNLKGESIAPQRVENLFRDFESVKRVFLVGDHREYNTALIVPNPEATNIDLQALSERERRDHFRSLVVSVNQFLAPFERIVDFAVLDRDFDEDRGELTPKGTFRRRAIVDNFEHTISELYRRARMRLETPGVTVEMPNWLYQSLGLTAGDIAVREDRLVSDATGQELRVAHLGPDPDAPGELYGIGSCLYRLRRPRIDLGALVGAGTLALGNTELARFAPLPWSARRAHRRAPADTELVGLGGSTPPSATERRELAKAVESERLAPETVDLAARCLGSEDDEAALLAVQALETAAYGPEGWSQRLALVGLRTAWSSPSEEARRRAFQVLLEIEPAMTVERTMRRFLRDADLFASDIALDHLAESAISDHALAVLVRLLEELLVSREAGPAPDTKREQEAAGRRLLAFLGRYGASHPGAYKRMRAAIARVLAFGRDPEVREQAERALDRMTEEFRRWLGPPVELAVDPETGREYGWDRVVTFEEDMAAHDRELILRALQETALVREAIFLFSGRMVRLSDIPPGGVWISLLGEKHGKAVFRLTVHTRFEGSFDLALNVNRELSPEQIADEILWLIVAGSAHDRSPLVEDFGGSWGEHGLWTEEFVAGETVHRFVQRLARERTEDARMRLRDIWPFVVWTGAEAYLEFWNRCGRRWVVADPSDYNVIVPTHDFQIGARIVSISEREPFVGMGTYLDRVWNELVGSVESRHEWLQGVAERRLMLSALIEVLGRDEGVAALREIGGGDSALAEEVGPFVEEIERLGFMPKRLYFAVRRYHRWAELARDATPQARARTMQELFETYNLVTLIDRYPAIRLRFFRETVFSRSAESFVAAIDDLIARVTRQQPDPDEMTELIGGLKQYVDEGSDEDFFLTRLTYPHLRPSDKAELVFTEAGGERRADVMVKIEDDDGMPFYVRHPISPKEVERLHRQFLAAKLEVTFRPEHHFLVAVNHRGDLVGGLFYELYPDEARAHLEKIVVHQSVRKKGISDGLMHELLSRLKAQGLRALTTGFFRPGYFYRFGFTIERGYAGLVRPLEDSRQIPASTEPTDVRIV
jgi:long-subunit acyl-CoA synthetase (AMP-forming)/GNAT superfamily N-acetyltransferase